MQSDTQKIREQLHRVTLIALQRLENALSEPDAISAAGLDLRKRSYELIFGTKHSLYDMLTILADLLEKLEMHEPNIYDDEPLGNISDADKLLVERFVQRMRGETAN